MKHYILLQKVLGSKPLTFWILPKLRILLQISDGRALSTGQSCICECVTLPQSFHSDTKSINSYIAQKLQPTFSISLLFRRCFESTIFSRFFVVTIATSHFLNEVYNSGFASGFSVLVFKKTTVAVQSYVYETRK